jgi:hypothetical protein
MIPRAKDGPMPGKATSIALSQVLISTTARDARW